MAEITFGTVINQFATDLAARENLAGVTVSQVPISTEPPTREWIEFGDVTDSDEPLKMGANVNFDSLESYDVEIRTMVFKPGGDEAAGKAARDRAIALATEVKTQLHGDPTIGGTCLNARFLRWEYKQGVLEPPSRWASVEFVVTVTASNE